MKKTSINPSAQRDIQFGHIKELTEESIGAGIPVVSIDGKKKEFLGSLYRDGRLWVKKGEELVRWDHDFPFLAEGKVTPFGIYDVAGNHGFMVLGESSETPRFIVDSLKLWWNWRGRHDYPDAKRLVVLADSGGGCSYRSHVLKEHLSEFSRSSGLEIRMAHYPPGCSKWNPIEHRLFPHISREIQGTVFEDHHQVGQLMERASTSGGLRVRAYYMPGQYPTKEKASSEFLSDPQIERHDPLPHLNYSFNPNRYTNHNIYTHSSN